MAKGNDERETLKRLLAEHGVDVEELQRQGPEKAEAFRRLRPLIDAAIEQEEEGRREHRRGS